jgi:hypothetical protein
VPTKAWRWDVRPQSQNNIDAFAKEFAGTRLCVQEDPLGGRKSDEAKRMTVVTIWLEPKDDAMWAVADTRISSRRDSGVTVSTDSAAKLFAIPIRCHRADAKPNFRRTPYFTTSVGFAFAGDVVPATMTVATAGTFLQNLMTVGAANPPRLSEIAEAVRRLAERFSKEKLSSSNGQLGDFHSAVFGWCPVLSRFAIYELVPRRQQSNFHIECLECLPTDSQGVVTFGTGAPRLIELIKLISEAGNEYTYRVPLSAAEALLHESKLDDVGGSLSIGLADRIEFRLYSYITPVVPGFPAAKMTFNGIDLAEEVGPVGHHFVAINGFA